MLPPATRQALRAGWQHLPGEPLTLLNAIRGRRDAQDQEREASADEPGQLLADLFGAAGDLALVAVAAAPSLISTPMVSP
jgi:hypothetical protein